MRLAKRLGRKKAEDEEAASASPVAAPVQDSYGASSREDIAAIARSLHHKILDRLDLGQVSAMAPEDLLAALRKVVDNLVDTEGISMSDGERGLLADSILNELTGYGPLEALLRDPSVSDVLVNRFDQIYIERGGKVELTDTRFRDEQHLLHTIQRMVAEVGRRIDESSPMVDARLRDGSRVNAIIPPLAIDGASLSIRRFGKAAITGETLLGFGAMSEDMLAYLKLAVASRCSILIAGGTGAGKTTMLNALSNYVSEDERLITIEDAAELRLAQTHVVRLESRPANLEGKGEVTIRDLVKNALRMRPDRVIVGEVRGAEVLDMLQAMNTGHEGSMATVHANTARDAMSRLVTMLGMTGTTLAEETMATLVSRAIHVVVHVTRLRDGQRKVSEIAEIVGQTGTNIQLSTVYEFERTGMTSDGSILGRFCHRTHTMLQDRFNSVIAPGTASGEIGGHS